jgi:ferritin-like metal-binding protein YciE
MAKAASNPELESAFSEHLAETEKQIERLERIFRVLDLPMRWQECVDMNEILKEGVDLLEKKKDFEPNVVDAALIAAALRVVEYESAAYDTICDFANMMGYNEVVNIFEEALTEQTKADEKLNEIDYQPMKILKRVS